MAKSKKEIQVTCLDCAGSGLDANEKLCPTCEGSGNVTAVQTEAAAEEEAETKEVSPDSAE